MNTTPPLRRFGRSSPINRRHTRVPDRFVIHGDPIDFRELCRRAVPPTTRYLIFDLDRTLHLNRNLGELLGWELIAYWGYGAEHLKALQADRPPGRFLFHWSSPLKLLRYLMLGAREWAGPGLYYLLWGKIAARVTWLRHQSFLRFGPEPVRVVQRVPQTALMHQLAEVPLTLLRDLAASVWKRHVGDQVVQREDIVWLRERCPEIRIIISSSSPQPMLEVAAQMLGVDDVAYTAQEEHAGYLSAPYWRDRLFSLPALPRRISPPSKMRYNSSYAKIEHLLSRFPEIADPNVESVGISDTGYGEDHCWAEYFSRVIDVNSDAPFCPVVTAKSPVQEIHSAFVLTRGEMEHRGRGQTGWFDPQRKPRTYGPIREFRHEELETMLASYIAKIELLAEAYQEQNERLSASQGPLILQSGNTQQAIEDAARAYNDADSFGRQQGLRAIHELVGQDKALREQLAQAERPLSEIAFELNEQCVALRKLFNNPTMRHVQIPA